MRTRRSPSGSLAALAVLLAALAVVVVAGARTPLIRNLVGPAPATSSTAPPVTTTTVGVSSGSHGGGGGVDHQPVEQVSHTPPVEPPPTSAPTTTTSTSTTSTTSTTTSTTTTTTPPQGPSSRHGVFQGGQTTTATRLGAVRVVTASVPTGTRVTLTVSCGISSDTASDTTTVTVHVLSAGSACIATIRVPAATPEPASWHLVAR